MTPETIDKAIADILRERVSSIVSEEADAAVKRVEQRVKEQTASIAASVLRYYSMEQRGNEIVIRVQMPPEKP